MGIKLETKFKNKKKVWEFFESKMVAYLKKKKILLDYLKITLILFCKTTGSSKFVTLF